MGLKLDSVRSLRPSYQQADSISVLGGRQELKVDLLKRVLDAFFDGKTEQVGPNEVHVKVPILSNEEAVGVCFSGAMDAVVEDRKFALCVVQSACSAGLTLKRADGSEISATPVHDFDGLLRVLGLFWPERIDARE